MAKKTKSTAKGGVTQKTIRLPDEFWRALRHSTEAEPIAKRLIEVIRDPAAHKKMKAAIANMD